MFVKQNYTVSMIIHKNHNHSEKHKSTFIYKHKSPCEIKISQIKS